MTVTTLKGRDFISLHDWSRDELEEVLELAQWQKARLKAGIRDEPLKGKQLGMYFAKPSTRTRLSFEVGIRQLGGDALFLSAHDLQLQRGESIADTARVMSRFLDGIMIRTFSHREVVELAEWATIPVINGLTDEEHPCQVVADLLTALERFGTLPGLKLAYVGDGNNVAHSLMMGASKLGLHMAVATPEGYDPDPEVIQLSKENAARTGGTLTLCRDPKEAVADADVVYTDVWTSMGFEAEQEERLRAFRNFQVNEALVRYAKPDYLFMHCLPAHRGEEVSDGVIDGPNSVVFDQAENRLHAQKAIMATIM